MKRKTGVKIHVSRMSCALAVISARPGRPQTDLPKPVGACPWSKHATDRRIRAIQRLIDNLPKDDVVFYDDEVDVHLNSTIGLDGSSCCFGNSGSITQMHSGPPDSRPPFGNGCHLVTARNPGANAMTRRTEHKRPTRTTRSPPCRPRDPSGDVPGRRART